VGSITTDSPNAPLLGPGESNIGAPAGWHMFTMDDLGNAWDNFGFKGNAGDWLGRILEANPGGINVTFSSNFWDAWNEIIEPFRSLVGGP